MKKLINERFVQRVSQSRRELSIVFELLAKQKITNDWMFEGWNWKQGTGACTKPINNDMVDFCVAWASPLETGAQNRIEISARVIEGFKIENWYENNHHPCDVMMPEHQQSSKFFTSNDKWRSNETVKNCWVLWILFAQCLWSQSTEKRSNAFNYCTSQRGYLQIERDKNTSIARDDVWINFSLVRLIDVITCKSAEQSSNALPWCVFANSNHQKNWTNLHTQQPPISCAHVFRATSLGVVRPSTMSSMCVYGHAVESPQTWDHQTVNKNKYIAYVATPKLSATVERSRVVDKHFH